MAGEYDFAASRAYYAMFYAAEEALLMERGLVFSKHSGVIAEFNRQFVRPGLFEQRHFRALSEGLDERLVDDYQFQRPFPAETAARLIRHAEAFIDAAEEWLRRQPAA